MKITSLVVSAAALLNFFIAVNYFPDLIKQNKMKTIKNNENVTNTSNIDGMNGNNINREPKKKSQKIATKKFEELTPDQQEVFTAMRAMNGNDFPIPDLPFNVTATFKSRKVVNGVKKSITIDVDGYIETIELN